MTRSKQFNPDWATHPGEHLDEYLEIYEWTPADLANVIGIETEIIAGILDKKHPVTPHIASLLERVFGLKADIWLRLQERWDRMNPGRTAEPYPPID